MKVAIPLAEGRLCMHFGHCQQFAIIEVDEENRAIMGEAYETPPPHQPGVLPRWLAQLGVRVVIAGGMGGRAQQLFAQNDIDVICGAPSERPKELVQAWLDGSLATGENVCDH